MRLVTGRSAVWLARLPWEQEVGGSNPLAPTISTRSILSVHSKKSESFFRQIQYGRKQSGKIHAYFFSLLDFPIFFDTVFFTAFFAFGTGDGRQSISRFDASRPHESHMYFKLTSVGEHTCLGSLVIVPQYLHATTFFEGIGLQRCPFPCVTRPHVLQE